MTIREALGTEGALVAIWDESVRDDAQIVLYSLSGLKPRRVASEEVSKAEHVSMTADLRTRGARVGSGVGSGPFDFDIAFRRRWPAAARDSFSIGPIDIGFGPSATSRSCEQQSCCISSRCGEGVRVYDFRADRSVQFRSIFDGERSGRPGNV